MLHFLPLVFRFNLDSTSYYLGYVTTIDRKEPHTFGSVTLRVLSQSLHSMVVKTDVAISLW